MPNLKILKLFPEKKSVQTSIQEESALPSYSAKNFVSFFSIRVNKYEMKRQGSVGDTGQRPRSTGGMVVASGETTR